MCNEEEVVNLEEKDDESYKFCYENDDGPMLSEEDDYII